jgi:outer membrane protein insertion porin family
MLKKFYFSFLLLLSPLLAAQVVKDISIQGLSRYSESTVRLYSTVSVGDDLNETQIKEVIYNLFATDFFDDVKVTLNEEGLLVIDVLEKPVIAEIDFSGNSHFSKSRIDTLLAEYGISLGRTFSKKKLERFKRQVLDLYTVDGFYSSTVLLTYKSLGSGKVHLTINFNEGTVAKVSKIVFHGNKEISDRRLIKSMAIQPSSGFSFLFGTDKYSQYALEADIPRIENYYGQYGYPHAKVKDYRASLNEDRGGIILDIFIDEGSFELIDGFFVEGSDDLEMPKEYADGLPLPYSINTIEDVEKDLRKQLNDKGFFMQRIRHSLIKKDGKNFIQFIIFKGKPVYINSIHITGNMNTREDIIRHHIDLPEGALFSASQISSIEDSLMRTGFFSGVHITPTPVNDEKIDLTVHVHEAKTKKIAAGIQFSNIAVGGNLQIEDKNFFGTGYDVDFKVDVDKYDKDIKFAITNPYTFDNKISTSFLFDKKKHRYKNSALYTESSVDSLRAGLGFGLILDSKIHASTFFEYLSEKLPQKSDSIKNISLSGPQSEERIQMYGVKKTLFKNTYNYYQFPTKGDKASLSFYINTPFSDFNFYQVSGNIAKIFPLRHHFLFYSSIQANYVHPYVDGAKGYIPSSYYMHSYGAEDVRGYKFSALGPTFEDKIVEGNLKFVWKNEIIIPNKFLKIENDGVRVSAFFDAGQVYRTFKTEGINQSRGLYCGTGLTIRWMTPLLPLSMSFNIPLKQDVNQERVEYFSFSNMMEF